MTRNPEAEIRDSRLTPWMIWTAINDPRLLKAPRTALKRFDEASEKSFTLLTKEHHCDPVMLSDALATVTLFQKCLPAIDRQELRRFAAQLERDLIKMAEIVPSHNVLIAIEDDETTIEQADGLVAPEQARQDTANRGVRYRLRGTGDDSRVRGTSDGLVVREKAQGSAVKRQVRYEVMGTGGDLHPSPRFRQELENMVEGYRELADLNLRHLDYLKHICELLPVRYVHRRTGDPHFDDIATLLDWACPLNKTDPVHDPATLRRYYKQAASCLPHLDTLLYLMEQTKLQRGDFRVFQNSDKKIYRVELRNSTGGEMGNI